MSGHTRFFTKLSAILCAVSLLGFSESAAWAQTITFGQLPSTGWQTSKFSQAVVNDANQAVENLLIANQSGRLTASIVTSAATSMQILWDHMQEIGLNDALQKEILSNQEQFLEFHASDSEVNGYASRLASDGVNVSLDQVRSIMDPGPEARQEFLATIQSIGLYRAELQVIAQLKSVAQQLASEGAMNGQVSFHSSRRAHLVRVMSAACKACLILAGIGIPTLCIIEPICGAGIGTCLTCALGG